MTASELRFGPWSDNVDSIERQCRMRELRVLALLYLGQHHPLVAAATAAIGGDPEGEAAALALEELDRLPSLRRRRLLATAATLWAPRRRA